MGNQHGPFFDATAGGQKNLAKLGTAVDTEAARISDQENSRSQQQQASDRADEARRILLKGLRHVSTVSTLVPDDSTPTFERTLPKNDEQLIGRLLFNRGSAPNPGSSLAGAPCPAPLRRGRALRAPTVDLSAPNPGSVARGGPYTPLRSLAGADGAAAGKADRPVGCR